jgi:hypothetical protein
MWISRFFTISALMGHPKKQRPPRLTADVYVIS